MATNTNEKKGDRVKTLEIKLLVTFTTIILAVSVFMAFFIGKVSSESMKEEVSKLVRANTTQMGLNINSYLENIEKKAALMYADEAYYKYDATSVAYDEYARIKHEDNIRDRIIDIGTMDNFADFCIVYSNNYVIGWISDTTESMFIDESMYNTLKKHLDESDKDDAWIAGLMGNYERMYYIKKYNQNAILMLSFYTRELSEVFNVPKELEGMKTRLISDGGTILFSSETGENGQPLPKEVGNMIEGKSNYTTVNDKFLVNVNKCDNEWKVVCDIQTNIIMSTNNDMIKISFLIALIVAVVFSIFGTIAIRSASRPVDSMVSTLKKGATIDLLAEVLNKSTFEDAVKSSVEIYSGDKTIVFIMFDVDNFKKVNDTLGHKYGDEVIKRMGALLNRCFEDSCLIGRLGGDEFAMYVDFQMLYSEKEVAKMKKQMDIFCEVFIDEFQEEYKTCNVSLSIGMYIAKRTKTEKLTFDEIYQKTDAALYESKKSGKNKCTIYEKESK